jgi:long-chain fatty acid transport protein
MNTNLHINAKFLSAIVLACSTLTPLATGFRMPDQDAFATARGEAFVATADNASAIYYNPAGLTQLRGQNLRAGVYGIDLEPRYDSPSGSEFESKDNLHAVPQLFYAYSPEKLPLSFGFGAYAPFGLGIQWPHDTGFRTVGTEASLAYFTASPTVAWKIADTLSIGASLTVNYAEMDLRQGIVWPAQAFDEFRFKGTGWDMGYNVGVLWRAHEKLSFGGTFRSGTKVNLDGHTDARNDVALPSPPAPFPVPTFSQRTDAEADFDFPLMFVVGVSFRPTPKWNLEFNAEYTGWDALNTVTVKQDTAPVPGLIPQNIPIAFNWESSWYYEFGATRYFDNGWHVSAGYIFNENSVPDATYSPLVADLDRHFFSVGTGHKGKRFDFDFAYQFGYGPTRTVSGSAISPAGQSADGDYEFISHALLLTVGWHF